MKNQFDKKKLTKGIIYLILGIVFSLNTNSNPVPFIERILIPIQSDGVTIHYAGIFIIILVYRGIKLLAEVFNWKADKRVIILLLLTILTIVATNSVWNNIIKTYKSASDGLRSIYCDYDNQILYFKKINNDKLMINTRISLENLSSQEQQFKIKVKVPRELREELKVDEFTVLDREGDIAIYNVKGKMEKQIDSEFVLSIKDYERLKFWTTDFQFLLYNDEESVKFGHRYIVD